MYGRQFGLLAVAAAAALSSSGYGASASSADMLPLGAGLDTISEGGSTRVIHRRGKHKRNARRQKGHKVCPRFVK